MDENNKDNLPPAAPAESGAARPGLLKRTSSLFGLLGGSNPSASAPAEPPKQETIAEEPEVAPLIGSFPTAAEEPAAAAEEEFPAAFATAPAAAAEEEWPVVSDAAEQIIEPAAPMEAEAPAFADIAAKEPAASAEDVVEEAAVSPIQAPAAAFPDAAAEPEVPQGFASYLDEPEEFPPVDAAQEEPPALMAEDTAAPFAEETAAPFTEEHAAPFGEEAAAAEPMDLGEALRDEPLAEAEEKKVTFDEEPPKEIPPAAEPTSEPTSAEETKAKKKSFLGGLFSRNKKDEEAAPFTEAPAAADPVAAEPATADPVAAEEGHGGEVAAAAGVGAVAAAGGAAALAASSGDDAPEAPPAEQAAAPAAEEAPADAAAAAAEAPAEASVEPVHVGVLFKPGLYVKSHLKERHFRLMPDGLLQYSRTPTFKRSKNIKLVHEATVDAQDGEDEAEKNRFRVSIHMPNNRVYCLRAEAEEDRNAWVADIQRVCESLEAQPHESAPAA